MEVIRDLKLLPPAIHPVAALGNFDGVHRGHGAILKAAIDRAHSGGGKSYALTFEPLPAKVLTPQRAPRMLMTAEDKLEFLRDSGVDGVLVLHFDRALSRLSPRDFVRDYLLDRLKVEAMVVGHSVSFGHKRAGNAGVMVELGHEFGFETIVVGPVRVDGIEVSSSKIRELILAADLRAAARLLGRPHFLRGQVVHGRERGRKIGFPTANLDSLTECIPPDGVYATRVVLPEGAYPSITNIGMRPTFNEAARAIEAHIFEFNRDIYDRTIKLEIIERVRPEQKFESGEALGRQIKLDLERARQILAAAD
jgi:riboflavin kinase / FMN adenylyltransferase